MRPHTAKATLLLLAILSSTWISTTRQSPTIAKAQSGSSVYLPLILTYNNPPKITGARINVPHFNFWRNAAIAWFGQVNPTDNYADIRIGYSDEALLVDVHIFDRRVWYDSTPSLADLSAWDAVTLYLNTEGNQAKTLDEHAFQFVAQFRWWENADDYQASYQGDSTGWQLVTVPFTSTTFYQGDVPNNNVDDRGWNATFEIPFTSLGLSATPQEGSLWGLGLAVHDRDDEAGTPIADQTWLPGMSSSDPSTWGQIHFGLPGFTPPQATDLQTVMIRHKLNGAVVQDADVGGDTICGEPFNPDFFNGWGDANYAGSVDLNIQNQGNLGDWPCFSKVYITFPLDAIPLDKVIVSAELVMYQFGNSDPSQANDSLIQVLTVSQDWDETTITWNNAPLALENVSQATVEPLPVYPGVPGVERRWDVGRAAGQAYQAGIPLRLGLYSADMAMHSGKYFNSSDVDDYMPEARPALLVTYGDP